MKKALNKISDLLFQIVTPVGCLIFAVLVISTTIQVLCRYFLKVSVPWTEELARFSFIWATMLGASSLVKTKGHPAVDALTGKLTGTPKYIQELIVCLIMLAMCYIGVKYGFQLVKKTMRQLSPVMKIPYGYVYLSYPVGCIAMIIHLLSQLADIFSQMIYKKGREEV